MVPMDVKNFKEKRQIATDKLLQYLQQKRSHPPAGGGSSAGQREKSTGTGSHLGGSARTHDVQNLPAQLFDRGGVTTNLGTAGGYAGNGQWEQPMAQGQTAHGSLSHLQHHSPLPPHVQEFIARVSSGEGQDLSFGQLQQIATATGYDIIPKEFDSFQDRRRRAFEALRAIVHAPTAAAVAQTQKRTIFVDGSNESVARAQKESQVRCLCLAE